ncbi:MAG: substrate-binding domain-containing protein [Prevotella sp.]|nr:substrate-binding domain-containing protein [Prevotella sp.]
MKRKLYFIILLFFIIGLCACTDKKKYRIAVSQCSQDIWRDKLNEELMMSTYLYDNVELLLASADDNDKLQVEQINQFVKDGVDLLIVAPNQMATVTPAIDRAYDMGLPVIVFDRKTSSEKFTAYIGADNYEMGKLMGEYIAAQLQGKGKVLEIQGLKGSSPAMERHDGFVDALKAHPAITLVASLQGDWTEESAMQAVKDYDGDLSGIDFVFGQNDRMAVGARKALNNTHTRYCGIDALPGKDNGVDYVQRGILDASYIYPTRGDLVMQLAMDILEHRPFYRENKMKAAIVNSGNATVTMMQAEEMSQQRQRLDELHNKTDWYLTKYHHQQVYTLLMGIILFLIIGGAWYIMRMMARRHQLEREAYALVVGSQSELPTPTERMSDTDDEQLSDDQDMTTRSSIVEVTAEERSRIEGEDSQDTRFLEVLRKKVQDNMSNGDFGVEALANEIGMSRVQLYRKVKMLTGHTPVDIIRLSRLNRAKVLLASTRKTVSEIAYEVGFSAPSYFTKCFKDEFGISPSDLEKH